MGTVSDSSLDGGVPAGGRDMGRLATDESKQNYIFGGDFTCKRTVGRVSGEIGNTDIRAVYECIYP